MVHLNYCYHWRAIISLVECASVCVIDKLSLFLGSLANYLHRLRSAEINFFYENYYYYSGQCRIFCICWMLHWSESVGLGCFEGAIIRALHSMIGIMQMDARSMQIGNWIRRRRTTTRWRVNCVCLMCLFWFNLNATLRYMYISRQQQLMTAPPRPDGRNFLVQCKEKTQNG